MRSSTNIQKMAWLICALGALFYCYEYFLRISPSVFTKELMVTYHLNYAALGGLIALYYYAYTPMQLPVGILMDRYGPRLLLTLASLCCAIGSILFAATHNPVIAGLGRFLVGFGSSFAFVGVLKLASIWLRPDRFAMIAGLATTLGMVGAMVGENLLTYLVDHFGWRETTYSSAFFGIMLAIIIWLNVRNAHKTNNTFAYKKIEWSSVFKDILEALKSPQLWLVGIVGGLLYIPTSVFAELWGVPYLEQARHFSPYQASAAVSMIFLGWAIGGPIVGAISDKLRLRKSPLLIGSIVAAVLLGWLLYTRHLPITLIFIIFLVFGMVSSVQNITFAIARESCSDRIAGSAVAINNMLVMFGGMFLQPLVGRLLDSRLHLNNHPLSNHVYVPASFSDYRYALSIMVVGLILAAIITLFIRETHAKPRVAK